VTRATDFGAFIELETGIEGMVHLSEMSWAKKVHKPSDMLKPGETVEVMILGINAPERRMSLGLKQTLGDPWAEAQEKFTFGSTVEGAVVSLTKFGAFVQLAEGVEGMIHVSEISAEKRVERPQDVLRVGQVVKAKVLDVDKEKRQIKLSMKQLVPTGLDEYIAEHKEGDVVTGRLIEVTGDSATVELGEGIRSRCRMVAAAAKEEQFVAAGQVDLSAFSSMLKERWQNGPVSVAKTDEVRAGQIRSFKITKLDLDAKTIEVQLV
jgi:small subunit ribosomal protein S1